MAELKLDAATDSFRKYLDALYTRDPSRFESIDPETIALKAAEWVAGAMDVADQSLLARRIGPVYRTEALAEYLTPPGAAPLTTEAVRKRAHQHQLVAFQTDDRQWAFPVYQFLSLGGRLEPRTEVIRLWRTLPHDGFLTAADLAAWMNTRFGALDDGTPAVYAHRHGADAQPLLDAVGRLVARAA